MQNKKIVMCGCLEAGWESVKGLLENGISFTYFVLIAKEKAEEQKVAGYRDFSDLAKQYNIPIYYVQKYSMKSEKDLAFFQQNKFDLLVQGGWQRLFPDEILQTLSIGAIGIHGSSEFLPKGRGRSPINWSLIEGKKRFIIHYFIIKAGVDDGDVFHYEMFDINEWDTCKTLYYKNAIITQKILLNFIPKLLKNDFIIYPQEGEASYYPKRTEKDGQIDWTKNVFEIYNFIRALTKPYPGAFSFVNNERIFIWQAQPFDTRITYHQSKEGEVVAVFVNGDFIVNCNSGLLLVTNYDSNEIIFKGLVLKNNI
jgi:methionyl-tRNA formyltransferase